ncbi:MAG: divergent polysaccharide deacetylase family protein [Thermodesulfobacteriota bacterium]
MAKRSGKKAGQGGKRGKGRLLSVLFLLLLLAGSLGAAGYFIFLRSPGSEVAADSKPAKTNQHYQPPIPLRAGQPGQSAHPLPGQEPPLPMPRERDLPSDPPAENSPAQDVGPPAEHAGKPRLAIVVDDMGLRDEAGKEMLALDLVLSFSFLPFSPFGEAQQKTARGKGRDILLHLPLEPKDRKWDPGPGTLLASMDATTIQSRFTEALNSVPGAVGVNNHMGSRFTADRVAMEQLLAVLKQKQLFFLDSLTTPESVGPRLATAMGIPFAKRTVFLDNQQDQAAIASQIGVLIERAKSEGEAIGICHPHPATIAALRDQGDRLRDQTVLVGVSRLVH